MATAVPSSFATWAASRSASLRSSFLPQINTAPPLGPFHAQWHGTDRQRHHQSTLYQTLPSAIYLITRFQCLGVSASQRYWNFLPATSGTSRQWHFPQHVLAEGVAREVVNSEARKNLCNSNDALMSNIKHQGICSLSLGLFNVLGVRGPADQEHTGRGCHDQLSQHRSAARSPASRTCGSNIVWA